MRKRINCIKIIICFIIILIALILIIVSAILILNLFLNHDDKAFKYLGLSTLIISGILMFLYSSNHLIKMIPKRKRKF